MYVLQRHEKCKLMKPRSVPFAKRLELLPIAPRAALKLCERLAQQRQLPGNDRSKVDDLERKLGAFGQVLCREIAAVEQALHADQQGIAGKGGKALIRRVSVAGRTERQHLPDALSGIPQEVGEGMRLRAQFSD